MSELHEYFKQLSEGKLDISKTVEYQFIKTLKELDTPIGLNDFAKNLKMTSIVSNFINLMTKGGLIDQSPLGIDTNTNLPGSINEKPIKENPIEVVKNPKIPPLIQQVDSDVPQSSDPQINEAVNKLKKMTSELREQQIKEDQQRIQSSQSNSVHSKNSGIPRPNLPPSPNSSKNDSEELPEHMKAKLDQERAKTGSKKQEEEDIDDIFGNLGSLEDELDD